MSKGLGSIVAVLVGLGIAWGLATWMGDGETVFTQPWWEAATERITNMQDGARKEFEEHAPDPESIDKPSVADSTAGKE